MVKGAAVHLLRLCGFGGWGVGFRGLGFKVLRFESSVCGSGARRYICSAFVGLGVGGWVLGF